MALLAAYAVPHPPLIVPAVGHGQEAAIADTIAAYREVARRVAAPPTRPYRHHLASRAAVP